MSGLVDLLRDEPLRKEDGRHGPGDAVHGLVLALRDLTEYGINYREIGSKTVKTKRGNGGSRDAILIELYVVVGM